MNIKTAYVAALIVFYISIPVIWNTEKLIFWIRGYDKELVFEKKDTYANEEMIDKYYAAYKRERTLIMFVAWSIVTVWVLMFIFSVIVMRKGVVPFKLDIITTVISLVMILILVVPILIFGEGWPPRPF